MIWIGTIQKNDRYVSWERGITMDIVYIGITVALSVLSWLFVKLAERV